MDMPNGKLLIKMVFGSHLYGTDTPASDKDFKGVYVPHRREILLQRAPAVRHSSTRPPGEAKNSADDVDEEIFSLHKFAQLLLENQTVALDMVFAPEPFWINRSQVWRDLISQPTMFLSRNCTAYVGYCQKQAAKYGVKGSRVAAVRKALWQLSFIDQGARLQDHEDLVRPLVGVEHIAIVDIPSKKDGPPLPHLEVCNRKFSFSLRVHYVVEQLTKIMGEYGQRALLAEKNEGIDWKALSHAVRVCDEAKQILRDHTIVFPLATAEKLRDIKLGRFQYRAVAEMIEQGLVEVERERELSTLRDLPNKDRLDDFVATVYDREAQ